MAQRLPCALASWLGGMAELWMDTAPARPALSQGHSTGAGDIIMIIIVLIDISITSDVARNTCGIQLTLQRIIYIFPSLNTLANPVQILSKSKHSWVPPSLGSQFQLHVPAHSSEHLKCSLTIPYGFWLVCRVSFVTVTAATSLSNDSRAHSKYNTCILASWHHRIYPNPLGELPPQKPPTDFHYPHKLMMK